jgi:tellurite resistance protein TehA-like permease
VFNNIQYSLCNANVSREFPIHTMTPIWIFPAYPALLLAPLASNIISSLPDGASAERINAIAITYGAVCVQGTGFMVSLMIYSAFIYRLMTQKLPRENRRPGMVSSSYRADKNLVTNSNSSCQSDRVALQFPALSILV